MKYELPLEYNYILLRYHEIGLKGNNRHLFEKRLVKNARFALKGLEGLEIIRERGRVYVHLENERAFSKDEMEFACEQLQKVFGLESFSPVFRTEPNWEAIKTAVTTSLPHIYKVHAEGKEEGAEITFRTRARRGYKKFPFSSNEIEIETLTEVAKIYPDIKLDLDNAEITVGIEVREEDSFIFFEQIQGPGGLPVGTSDKVLALMSGGIDSPVACYHTMKRGSEVDFLTFHSHPYTSLNVLDKIGQLINVLAEYQGRSSYFACNMANSQKAVRDNCDPSMRTILYRRIMMRVAEVVAGHRHTLALLTGESVAQVASQTIRNMNCINAATDMLILRPLVGTDKQVAINTARKIGTYEISNIPADDSCTVFAPPKPITNAKLKKCYINESKLDMQALVKDCIENTVQIDSLTGNQYETPELLEFYEKNFADKWV